MPPTASLVAFRFGYGLPLAESAPTTADQMLAALAGPDALAARHPIPSFDWVHARVSDIALNKKAAKADPALQTRLTAVSDELRAAGRNALRATLARIVDSGDGFRERLVAFWADHFTISLGGQEQAVWAYTFAEDCIRPHIAGRFGDMLGAVVHHPAMLRYLDQTRSIGPTSRQGLRNGGGLNENLARELLELHTLGVGGAYSQTDVRELAELLTGLTYDERRGYAFNRRMAEPGAETVLGQSYDGKGEAPIRAFLHDLAARADTGRHICHKLAVHFASDTPDPALVDAMATAWVDGQGALLPVLAAMLRHEAAWAEPLVKARQPWDFVAAALRALGVTGEAIMGWPDDLLARAVTAPLAAMGQNWKLPPGPDGWPEELHEWITPQGLAERIGWAMRWPSELARPLPEPKALAETALGDRASPALLWAVVRAENRAEGVGIVFSSPEFNRR